MESADEVTVDRVFAEGSATLKEDIPRNELSVRYLRASALSCYGQFTEALKLELEDKESLGEYGNLTCRVLSIGRHPPRKVKKQPDPNDKDGSGLETVLETVPVHRDELKEFLVKHFTIDGRRPTIITYGVFNTRAEPAMSKED
eukprot:2461813-Rhodomonas_salina.1